MHVQDLKRWHWVVVAVVIGIALSIAWSNIEWDPDLPGIGQRDFEVGLTIPYPQQGHLSHITVMPPIDGQYKIVAERMLNTQKRGVMDIRPIIYLANTPYIAEQWSGHGEKFNTVLDYLSAMKKTNPDMGIDYRYAWWRETWAIYLLWIGASVLLIGGVWPSVVSLMVGAGLGFHPKEKSPEYDLDRFKSEEAAKPAARPEPTPAELEHLKQLENELERKLEADRLGMPMPADEPAASRGSPAAPRKLDAGPLEAASADKRAEEHDYKGEFYPVDRSGKKTRG